MEWLEIYSGIPGLIVWYVPACLKISSSRHPLLVIVCLIAVFGPLVWYHYLEVWYSWRVEASPARYICILSLMAHGYSIFEPQ